MEQVDRFDVSRDGTASRLDRLRERLAALATLLLLSASFPSGAAEVGPSVAPANPPAALLQR